jgi:uncharacterized protein
MRSCLQHVLRICVLGTVLTCEGLVAFAGEPTAEHLAEARALFSDIGATRLMDQFLTAVIRAEVPLLKKAEPNLSNKEIQVFADTARKEMLADSDELSEEIARQYADYLSIDEIRQIRAFWSSPVGKKYLEVQPSLIQASMQIGQQWARRHMPDIIHKATEQMKKNGG